MLSINALKHYTKNYVNKNWLASETIKEKTSHTEFISPHQKISKTTLIPRTGCNQLPNRGHYSFLLKIRKNRNRKVNPIQR